MPDAVALPQPVTAVCDRFLQLAPNGLVNGLCLHGGLGFEEWINGQFDTYAGAAIASLPIWTDAGVLRAYTRENLDTYWRGWAERLPALAEDAPHDWITSWCVLGVARLHHLLVTGEMTAKSAAGHWGLAHYGPRWHSVLREALRLRDGRAGAEYGDVAARTRMLRTSPRTWSPRAPCESVSARPGSGGPRRRGRSGTGPESAPRR